MTSAWTDPGRCTLRRARHPLAAAWIALSLVGAQLAGVIHRIEHAPWGHAAWSAPGKAHAHRDAHDCESAHGQADATASLIARGVAQALFLAHAHQERDAVHDCAAFDAMALADGPPLAVAAPAGLGPLRFALDRGFAAPRAIGLAAYRSRAPPVV